MTRRRQAESIAALIIGLVASFVIPPLIDDLPHELALDIIRGLAVAGAAVAGASLVGVLYGVANRDQGA